MKHASPETLDRLSDLLAQVAALPGVKEKKPGVYYLKGRALLHFHEEGEQVYADVRFPGDADFERLEVSSQAEQRKLADSLARRLRQAT